MEEPVMPAEEIGAEWLGESPRAYQFYDGTVTLYFDKDSHRYYRYDAAGNEVTVSGVTSACGIVDKSAALVPWAAKMTCDYIREQWEALKDPILNPDGESLDDALMEQWLDRARFNHSNYKDKAADTGHQAHTWIEMWIKALIVTKGDTNSPTLIKLQNEMPEDERARNGVLASLDWMQKHNVKWIYTERKIYSKKYDFAGTLDGLALVSSCGDPECCGVYENVQDIGLVRVPATFVDTLTIIDWKTSNRLYESYSWQAAAYTSAIIEELGLDISHRIIIRLGKESADFEARLLVPETFQTDLNIFCECLALYKSVEAAKCAERDLKTALKEAKAAAKEREEAAVRARRLLKKERIAEARLAAKLLYKELRAAKIAVAEATRQSDSALAEAFQQIAVEFGDEVPAEELAA